MTIRWVYLDESEFQLNGQPYIAYGALITEDIIKQDNINKALNTLQTFKDNQDPDYNQKMTTGLLKEAIFMLVMIHVVHIHLFA